MPPRRNFRKSSRLVKPVNSLLNLKKLPSNKDVLQRRRTLQNEYIGKPKCTFLTKLAKEIVETWRKQDVPVQSWRVIYNKLQRSRLSEDNGLFDCLPNNPVWKTNEDKIYYLNQKQNLGGYCTSKEVSYNIHPSKQPRRYDQIPEAAQIHEHENEVEEDCDSDAGDDDSEPNSTPQVA